MEKAAECIGFANHKGGSVKTSDKPGRIKVSKVG